MELAKKFLFFGAIFIIVLYLSSCTIEGPLIKEEPFIEEEFKEGQGLKQLKDSKELTAFFKELKDERPVLFDFGGMRFVSEEFDTLQVLESAVVPRMKSATVTSAGGAEQYSQTNIQVEGVDEADIVKNDGKYIYSIVQNKLVIVDSYPPNTANIASEIDIIGNPLNLFVNEDRLVLFSNFHRDVPYPVMRPGFDVEKAIIPRRRSTAETNILVYDIKDRRKPKLVSNYSLDGYYFESRMIGDYVYTVAKDDVYYYGGPMPMPALWVEDREIAVSPVYYFDNFENNFVFHTIASFNVFDEEDVNLETFMLGHGNTMYVSLDNLYIAYQKSMPYQYYDRVEEDRFFKVIVPLLPKEMQKELLLIRNQYEGNVMWQNVYEKFQEMFNELSKKEKDELQVKIDEAIFEYQKKMAEERSKTVIHKFEIDKGEVDYRGKGEVTGQLLNQFSLDEYDEHLRVATTTYIYMGRGSTMHNNVYVLDKEMEVVGEIKEIAPGERIYSTRFIGEKLYMVTFKNIDPLFVIDLSDPKKPEILGELKIPGFSDYLHPYDEGHIIGIGKDTKDNKWGGISTAGLKLALFDVSDVENPKQRAQYIIGGSGTDSEALREHKAFLFDKRKNILVIPVTEVKDNDWRTTWQGAYVFGVTPEEGFEVKGKITHAEAKLRPKYYYDWNTFIRRSLYMDNVLYTVSLKMIKMNDLKNPGNEINRIKLPYEEGGIIEKSVF